MTKFNVLEFIANNAGLSIVEAIEKAYELGKAETLQAKLDEIITKQIDISNNQIECQTLRWVLDKMSEVEE